MSMMDNEILFNETNDFDSLKYVKFETIFSSLI